MSTRSVWFSLYFCNAAVASLAAACRVMTAVQHLMSGGVLGKWHSGRRQCHGQQGRAATLGFLASSASYMGRSFLSSASIAGCPNSRSG